MQYCKKQTTYLGEIWWPCSHSKVTVVSSHFRSPMISPQSFCDWCIPSVNPCFKAAHWVDMDKFVRILKVVTTQHEFFTLVLYLAMCILIVTSLVGENAQWQRFKAKLNWLITQSLMLICLWDMGSPPRLTTCHNYVNETCQGLWNLENFTKQHKVPHLKQ